MAQRPDKSDENGLSEPEMVTSEFSARHASISKRAERLRSAIKSAGGPRAVSRRTGIPLATLNHYLSGRDMKAEALVELAGACWVEVEWLATGRGPMIKDTGNISELKSPFREGPPPSPSQVATSWPIFSESDAVRIGAALSLSQAAIRQGEAPVNAGLLLTALSDFYSAFAALDAEPQRLWPQLDRLTRKYAAEADAAEAAAEVPAPPSKSP